MRPAWRLLWQDPAFKPTINKQTENENVLTLRCLQVSARSLPKLWAVFSCCPRLVAGWGKWEGTRFLCLKMDLLLLCGQQQRQSRGSP